MTDVVDVTREYQEQIKALRNEYVEKSKQAFADGTRALFEKHPKLEDFSWKQYTNYYCDGDPCYFRVRAHPEAMTLTFDGKEFLEEWHSGDMDDDGNTILTYYDTFTYDVEKGYERVPVAGMELVAAAYDDVSAFLAAFDDELMKEMFDDHVEVTVNRNGEVTSREYDHD